jgi:hypothetical protein
MQQITTETFGTYLNFYCSNCNNLLPKLPFQIIQQFTTVTFGDDMPTFVLFQMQQFSPEIFGGLCKKITTKTFSGMITFVPFLIMHHITTETFGYMFAL